MCNNRKTLMYIAMLLAFSGAAGLFACGEDDRKGVSSMALTEACFKISACVVDPYDPYLSYSFQMCIRSYEESYLLASSVEFGVTDRYHRCAARAGSCDEVRSCLGRECSEIDPYCDKDSIVECLLGYMVKIPCKETGMGSRCLVTDEGWATCGSQTCVEPNVWCEGDVAVRCSGGVQSREDCRADPYLSDGTCQYGYCEHRAAGSCDGMTFRSYCEGNTLVTCESGEIHRFDCGLYPYHPTCGAIGTYAGCVFDTGIICNESSQGCFGSVARLCVGTLVEYDCASFGAECYLDYNDVPECVSPYYY